MSTPTKTSSTTAPRGGAGSPSTARRDGRARFVVGYLAVAAVLPYLVLKLMWISGSTVGIAETSPLDAAVVQGGNLVTVAMELFAVAIILAFTHSWGLRAPAWLVLVPTWIGMGLLAPFLITGPVVAVFVTTEPSSVGDGSLAPWVGPLVYLGFGAQAVGITISFVLYARARWGRELTGRLSDRPSGPSRPALLPVTWGIVALLTVVSASRLLWSLGATWGLTPQLVESRGAVERLADATSALFAIGAVMGLLMLVRRRPGRERAWVPVVLAWVGGGATLSSGAYSLVLLLTRLAGPAASVPTAGVVPFVDLVQVVAGTATAVAGAVLLAELRPIRR
ncbi:hypothetical protein APR04_002150 [Promicromonospora umidemergens]|nr:hypothetical protein [Promicromonospora umidemergens]MCP2283247.1 hypothetical protein [Promicromonospora umidemergens]